MHVNFAFLQYTIRVISQQAPADGSQLSKRLQVLCESISGNNSLHKLELPGNDITDGGVRAMASILCNNTGLQVLKLSRNSIGDKGAIALAEAIKANTTLEYLTLYHNDISGVGCQALCAALASNTTLTRLELLPGNKVPSKDARALAKAVRRNKRYANMSATMISLQIACHI